MGQELRLDYLHIPNSETLMRLNETTEGIKEYLIYLKIVFGSII